MLKRLVENSTGRSQLWDERELQAKCEFIAVIVCYSRSIKVAPSFCYLQVKVECKCEQRTSSHLCKLSKSNADN